ncbi:MAG: hypothetical protein NTV51_11110 [Verrucomicrobia bacterium]|nr:hypothetical protein [Verrucomicrobiota bacterium]
MKALLLLLCVSTLLSACVSPEIRERAQRIEAEVRAKYDLDAVQRFLKQTVTEHPVHDGVTLSKRLGHRWTFEPVDPPARMRSGDWVLCDQSRNGDVFELYFWTDKGSVITLHVKRLAKDRFELLQITSDRVLDLPAKKQPNQPPPRSGLAPGRGSA